MEKLKEALSLRGGERSRGLASTQPALSEELLYLARCSNKAQPWEGEKSSTEMILLKWELRVP